MSVTIPVIVFQSPLFTAFLAFLVVLFVIWVFKFVLSLIVGG